MRFDRYLLKRTTIVRNQAARVLVVAGVRALKQIVTKNPQGDSDTSIVASRDAGLYRFKPGKLGHGRNSRGQKVADQSSPANNRAHSGRRRVAGAQRPAPFPGSSPL
jgi:hypothetical protein